MQTLAIECLLKVLLVSDVSPTTNGPLTTDTIEIHSDGSMTQLNTSISEPCLYILAKAFNCFKNLQLPNLLRVREICAIEMLHF